MRFWKVQRGTGEANTEGSAARAIAPRLEEIRLFTRSGPVDGWLVATDERVTDLLNQRASLRICTDPAADTWQTVGRDELMLVAPPPLAGRTGRAIHRHKRRVMAQVGPYVIEGVVYLPPGLPLDPYLLRTRQHFMAMTNAIVKTADQGEAPGEVYSVVVVNVRNLEELRLLVTLA